MTRPTRSLLLLGALFVGTLVLLLAVVERFLLPAAEASRGLDPTSRQKMAAIALLALTVVLFVLAAGLLIALRPGKLLFGNREPTQRAARTNYSDAWAESAKRVQTPPADEDGDDADADPESGPRA